MSYFLRFFLSFLLIPVFLVLLLIAIPVLMLITCVTARMPRHASMKTFTINWPPGQTADKEPPFSGDESVYDVDCTVISSAPLEENSESIKHGTPLFIQDSGRSTDDPPSGEKREII